MYSIYCVATSYAIMEFEETNCVPVTHINTICALHHANTYSILVHIIYVHSSVLFRKMVHLVNECGVLRWFPLFCYTFRSLRTGK